MLLKLIAFVSASLLWLAPGHATTYYVAGNGAGTACSVTAPCNGLQIALNAARPGDSIVCVTPPSDSALYINVSVSIDCASARALFQYQSYFGAGIIINIPVSSSDPLRTVRLRGLTIDGAINTAVEPSGRLYVRGIEIQAAAVVYIEDCVIENVTQQGIYDHRTGGQTKLFVKDTVVSGAGGAGIVAASAAVGITVLDNVSSENNAYGVAAAAGNNVVIGRSVFSGNSTAGIEGDAGSQIIVDGSKITHNNIGVQSASSVRISNNDIAFNNNGISGASGTFGNNRFSGNGSIGTVPTALGGVSTDLGQQ